MSNNTGVKTILILAAIPDGLRLDKEIRSIDEAIRRASKRDLFKITPSRTAVRTDDIRRAIAEEQPQIVHFCGHGREDGSLMLEDDAGENKFVSAEALAFLFERYADCVECVLLNACHSAKAATAISEYINYAIGMNQPIGDEAAIAFAKGFYDGLGYPTANNQDVFQKAFNEGKHAIQLENLPEWQIPVLKTKTKDKPYKYRDVAILVKFLAPCLPFLITVDNKAVEGASQKLGEDVWTKAKPIWAKLQPKVERKLTVLEAAADVAKAPDEEDLRLELCVQLKKLLEQDEFLAEEIARIMQEAPSNSGDKVVQHVTGDNNPTLGSVQGSTDKCSTTESPVSKKTILVLALGSIAQPRQEMHDEVITIKDALKRSLHPNKFDVKEKFVASYEDFQKEELKNYFIESRPWIVHIIEHGKAKAEELALDNEKDGETQLVNVDILAKFLSLVADHGLECVILNSGYSKLHAKLINFHVKYVIAMEQVITDDIKRFSNSFYTLLGNDFVLEQAYCSGCKSIKLTQRSENSKPLFFGLDSTIEQRNNYALEAQELLYTGYADCNEETKTPYRSLNNNYKAALDELQQKHNLLPEEAIAVNHLILELCKEEEKQFKKYEQKLKDVVERNGTLNQQNCKELSLHQKLWKISNKLTGLAYNNLAMCLYDKGKLEAAVDLFNESIKFNKDDPVAYLNLGYILYQQGKRVEGIDNLRTAKKLYQKMDMSDCVKQIEQDIENFEINNKINNNIIPKILRWLFRG